MITRVIHKAHRTIRKCIALVVCCLPLSAQGTEITSALQSSRGFIENRGQIRGDGADVAQVRYVLRMGSVRVFFRDNGFSYVVPVPDTSAAPPSIAYTISSSGLDRGNQAPRLTRLDCDFVGARTAGISATGVHKELHTYYYQGKEFSGVRIFDTIMYHEVYPGIDVRFCVFGGKLKYDFLVSPGADPRSIRMRFPQSEALAIGDSGELRAVHRYGVVTDDPPTADVINTDGSRQRREIRFESQHDRTFGFAMPDGYDVSKRLEIDPAITWSTFFGGRNEDEVTDAVISNTGFLVVCGWSLSDVFPGTTTLNQGDEDLFLVRFNADRTVNATTYFGGPKLDIASGIAVDEQDNIFIAGQSMSADLGFAQNVFQWANKNPGLYKDAVVIKFTNKLKYVTGTFVGGGDEDIALDVATDTRGNVIVVGNTHSDNYPTKTALFDTRRGTSGDVDACVTVFSNSLACLWSTYYGGRAAESATSCAVDSTGNVYVGGWTRSYDFPNLDGFQKNRSGDGDGFIIKFTAQGFPLNSTLFGGGGDENVNDIDVSHGRLVATGYTSSGNDLPAFGKKQAQDRAGGLSDGFLLCTDANLGFLWSTYWGGSGPDVFYATNIASDTSVVIAGYSGSPDMPLKRSLQLPHKDGLEDISVAKFSPSGSCLWSTIIGGAGSDVPNAMCLDGLDNMYIVGHSTGADFPVVKALYPTPQAPKDGVILKLCPTTPVVTLSPNDTVVCEGGMVMLSADPTLSRFQWNTGEVNASIYVKTAGTFFYEADSPLGCRTRSDTIRISVRQKTRAVIQRRGKSTLCSGDSVLLYSVTRFDAYSWRDATGREIGSKDSVYIKQPGTYHLNVTDRSGCYDSSLTETILFSAAPTLGFSFKRNGGASDTAIAAVVACTGDVIALTAQTNGLPIFWSNGASTPTIDINSSTRVTATVTDPAGCTWRMDTITVDFRKPSLLTLIASDTVCAGTSNIIRISEGANASSIVWNTDGGDVLSKLDSGTVLVRWNTPGIKRVRALGPVTGECIDTGYVNVVVRAGLTGKIASSVSGACRGELVRLSAPAGFKLYVWNGIAGDSVIQVSGAGRYDLMFGDGTGCVGTDTIVIGNRSNPYQGSSLLDFDSVDNTSFRQKNVRVSQLNEDYVLERVSLEIGTDFSISTVVPTVASSVNKSIETDIAVLFQPIASGDRYDTLVCVFSRPCRDTLRMPLKGYSRGLPPERTVIVSIPDTAVSVFGVSVTVPVRGMITSGQARIRFDSLKCALEYPATMLRFQSLENGSGRETIDKTTGRAVLELSVSNTTFTSQWSDVTRVTFAALLGTRDRDSVRFESCEVVPASLVTVTTRGAEWQWTDVCEEGEKRLIGQGSVFSLMTHPNPADEQIRAVIVVQQKGLYSIELLDLFGRPIDKKAMEFFANTTKETIFNVRELPEGMYMITIVGPSGELVQPVVIVHNR